MVNSIDSNSSKGKKGTVSVRQDSNCIKATHFGGDRQIKLSTGIPVKDGWEVIANKLQRRLQMDLELGKFDDGNSNFDIGRYQEILHDFGLKASLRHSKAKNTKAEDVVPLLSVFDVWDMYCDYIQESLAITTFELNYRRKFPNFLKEAINHIGSEDPIGIRNWLVTNRQLKDVKNLLKKLDEAYQLAIRQGKVAENPYNGLSDDIKGTKKNGVISQDDDVDDDVLNKSKAYTWNEAQAILDFLQNNKLLAHWYPITKFRLLTGCRTGEAIALWWCDVKWDKEQIVIRRNYSQICKKFKQTKNRTERLFPMPKDGELWQLLKSIPQREPNDVVFTSKEGKIININQLSRTWTGSTYNRSPGIFKRLLKQGSIAKILPYYNLRHTFITHQIYDLGRDEKIVNAWCEHSEDISRKHYQDTATLAMAINPEIPATKQAQQQSELDLLKEQLRKQQEYIDELMQNASKNNSTNH
jgi:integrase